MTKINLRYLLPLLGFFAVCCFNLFAHDVAMSIGKTPSQANKYRSINAVPRLIDHSWMTLSTWYQRHSEHLQLARESSPDILFLGDSITESWNWGEGRQEVYQQYFSQYKAANFAIGGDMTQNLLWRLQHGLKGNLSPKVAVIMIGTNNFLHQHQSPEEVAIGVKHVISQVQIMYPDIKVLTLGILPLFQNADNNSRLYVAQTNKLINNFADDMSVTFLDFSSKFLDKNGDIPQALMADFIHPTAQGLHIVAKHVAPAIKVLLGK
ncbi:GDSL-type esterase/lipase family protein [Psychrosphaera sp. 1_MG-2023]|uniref:GDSL-type esterase/lipase family protein n=1 Tax=Psychrosphaera sp. 1_MG-2023 TaxID=3062643 RepID=UPI0026E390A3|nr:GDSL-type esterase/lipase family protein [Psychrosphaera sp. 1_MG-2023]MDO6717789.1 GDSL-type esterase/lipase family protein [Psychrosphaera sp. 1_MG-2023]